MLESVYHFFIFLYITVYQVLCKYSYFQNTEKQRLCIVFGIINENYIRYVYVCMFMYTALKTKIMW